MAVVSPLDSDISLDPPARPSPPPAAMVEPSLPEMSPALRHQLARHELLLPLLRRSVVAAAVAGVKLSDEERKRAQQAWGASHGIRSAEDLQEVPGTA